jgi:hypothetical protein
VSQEIDRSIDRSLRSETARQENNLGIAHDPPETFASVFARSGRSLGGGGSPSRGVLAVHHGTAARAEARALLDHAGGDSLDVGDFMAA